MLTFQSVYFSAISRVFTAVDFEVMSVLLLSPQAFTPTIWISTIFLKNSKLKGPECETQLSSGLVQSTKAQLSCHY